MNDAQLELSLGQRSLGNHLNPRQRRLSRANWWFERMRQIADHAFDWQPRPQPRPEQIWFAGAQRQPRVQAVSHAGASAADPEQHQTCE